MPITQEERNRRHALRKARAAEAKRKKKEKELQRLEYWHAVKRGRAEKAASDDQHAIDREHRAGTCVRLLVCAFLC